MSNAEAASSGRVLVAMSGGVDSSVAASILRDQGRDVLGVTLRLFDHRPTPSTEEPGVGTAAEDASRVAGQLSIEHRVLDERDRFHEEIIEPFASEYAAGRTPNPCVWCNPKIKFGALLELADREGAKSLATGHYARIGRLENGAFALFRARDLSKDQTYFLYRLGQDELSRALFPLGELEKSEVRARASSLGLACAKREESQEICFVPEGSYDRYVDSILREIPPPGEIVHVDGRVLGEHRGVHRYTVGQRRGLAVASKERLYVVRIDAGSARVVLGPAEQLACTRLVLRSTRWGPVEPMTGRTFTVRVRYRHPGVDGVVAELEEGRAIVELSEPVRGAAPGQAVVLYDGEMVVGGGELEDAR